MWTCVHIGKAMKNTIYRLQQQRRCFCINPAFEKNELGFMEFSVSISRMCVCEYMTHIVDRLGNLKPGPEGPPVSGCGQTRPCCQARHSSPLRMLILMLTLVLTLATVLVSLCQPHADPPARAKRETDGIPTLEALLNIHYMTVSE